MQNQIKKARKQLRTSSLHAKGGQCTRRLLCLTCLLRLHERREPEAAALSTPRTD